MLRSLWILLLVLLVTAVLAEEKHKSGKKLKKLAKEQLQRDEELKETENLIDSGEEDSGEDSGNDPEEEEKIDYPCLHHKCSRGQQCNYDDDGNPFCSCKAECLFVHRRVKVCSSNNITYDSECLLDREYCYCTSGNPACSDPNNSNYFLDYFGPCRVLPECPDGQLDEFPGRMREWLFAVMKELANRNNLGGYLQLLSEAQSSERHAAAVLWKFCDLDKAPHDRMVTNREMLFTIASLKPMEPCLIPFLDECDEDEDNQISLSEWGICLGLERGEIEDKCLVINEISNQV